MAKDKLKKVFLIGQSGSGKSVCGKILSKKLSWDLLDTDKTLKISQEMSISNIFKKKGEAFFRSEELKILKELLPRENIVISTGAGLPAIEGCLEIMKSNGVVVWLKTSPIVIESRLNEEDESHRPLLFNKNESLLINLEKQLEKRYSIYSSADFVVTTDNKVPDLISSEICEIIGLKNGK